MVDDPWSRQLEGRVIYQHFTIFEPELRYLHFQRLARLARRLVISDGLLRQLAKAGPRERAVAFIVEHLHSSASDRRLLTIVAEIYGSSTEEGPLVICLGEEGNRHTDVSQQIIQLQRERFDFFVALAIGAFVTPGPAGTNPIAAEASLEGSFFGALGVSSLPSTSSDLLFHAARNLMAQWWRLESEILELPRHRIEEGSVFADQFGHDVVNRFSGKISDREISSSSLPSSPFCRDLSLAWRPSFDRVRHTIGASINHCSTLDDIKLLGTADA